MKRLSLHRPFSWLSAPHVSTSDAARGDVIPHYPRTWRGRRLAASWTEDASKPPGTDIRGETGIPVVSTVAGVAERLRRSVWSTQKLISAISEQRHVHVFEIAWWWKWSLLDISRSNELCKKQICTITVEIWTENAIHEKNIMQCNLLDAKVAKHPNMISTNRIEENHSWKFNSLASSYADK